MEHTILILILPFLSFLILGLAGMRMKNGLAGTIGTISLAGVTLLSYLTAFNYLQEGVRQKASILLSHLIILNGYLSQRTCILTWELCLILFPL